MRIIQFIPTLSSGGAERFVVDLSNEMAKEGHEVWLCVLSDQNILSFFKNQLIDKVNFHSFDIINKFNRKNLNLVSDFFKRLKPDVIHYHLIGFKFLLPQLFDKKIKIVETIHNVAEHAGSSNIQTLLNKFLLYRWRIRPVTISEQCRLSYNRFYRLDNSTTIVNGRSPLAPTSRYEEVGKELDNLMPSKDAKIFINVARCSTQKNQSVLIDAFNKLHELRPDTVLIIIGNGYDSELGKGLKEAAGNAVHFLGEKSNVGDYVLHSDFFCLSSLYEGLPITLLEAMSGGKPAICTPAGGCTDVIIQHQTGIISKDFSSARYMDAMLTALEGTWNEDVIKEEFNRHYSIDQCALEYLKVYSE